MLKSSHLRALFARLRRDEAGSASVELVASAAVALTMSVAAGDFGETLRGQAQLESAVRDAARMLSLTPLDASGTALLPQGVELARAELDARLAQAGMTPARLPAAPDGAECDAQISFCHRLDPIEGAEAALGRPRLLVRVWAGSEVDTRLLTSFDDEGSNGASHEGGIRLAARLDQVHAR